MLKKIFLLDDLLKVNMAQLRKEASSYIYHFTAKGSIHLKGILVGSILQLRKVSQVGILCV